MSWYAHLQESKYVDVIITVSVFFDIKHYSKILNICNEGTASPGTFDVAFLWPVP